MSVSKNRSSTVYPPNIVHGFALLWLQIHCIVDICATYLPIFSGLLIGTGKIIYADFRNAHEVTPMECGTKMKHDTVRSIHAIRKNFMTEKVTISSKQLSVVSEAGIKGRESN